MQAPTSSVVYVSYGLPKSASSFVFQLASAIGTRLANRSGRVPLDLVGIDPDVAAGRRGIYAEWLMDARGIPRGATGLDAVVAEVEAVLADGPPGVAVIKTHSACSPSLAARIAAGEILASTTFRHPADLVLSRIDMASREGQDLDHDVIDGYRRTHVPAFLTWRAVPTVAAFEYTDVARHPYAVARRIADQMGLDEDVHDIVDGLLGNPQRIFQFNKGVVDRRHLELEPAEIARIEGAVPDLMAVLSTHPPIYTEPTFAIVIPSLNSAATIDEALHSVIGQRGDFRVRVHVQDGGSTDTTLEHLERWARHLAGGDTPYAPGLEFTYASAPDSGMYDALQRGFARVEGDVYSWLGSDDVFLPAAFQTVTSLLRCDPRIDWVSGAQAMSRADGVPFDLDGVARRFPTRRALAAGLADGISAPFLQQEGTFWTDSLWNAVGRSLRTDLRYAGDFELWTRMARHSEPVATVYPLGSYRRRPGQLSADMNAYRREAAAVREALPPLMEPDEPLPLRLAALTWPDGTWRVTRMSSAPSPADQLAAGPEAAHDDPGWVVRGGDVPREGPFPELGIPRPFVWLTGRERVLLVRLPGPGAYRVSLLLGNPHRGQVVTCSGAGFAVTRRAPNTSAQNRPFTVRFEAEASGHELEVDLAFARAGSLADDPRELAVMLLSVDVEPTHERGLRRRRRARQPAAGR